MEEKIKFYNGDLLDSDADIIGHQCNARGVMGSGVALAIKNRYPEVFQSYRKFFEDGNLKLGKVDFAKTNNGKIVANMCGQDKYGRDGKQYTDYEALEKCFDKTARYMKENNLKTIAFPYNLGCGSGGGKWSVVFELIKEYFSDTNVEIWQLDTKR